jgi:hypothetical protein
VDRVPLNLVVGSMLYLDRPHLPWKLMSVSKGAQRAGGESHLYELHRRPALISRLAPGLDASSSNSSVSRRADEERATRLTVEARGETRGEARGEARGESRGEARGGRQEESQQ